MSNPYQAGPAMGAPVGGGTKPKNYLVESILLLVCCCGILAIPAIIFATQVDSKYNSGDYAGAVEASNQAKKWCLIGLIVGLVCGGGVGVFYIIMTVMAVGAGAGGGF